MCLKGSAIGALSALPLAMAADVVDLDSARTGKKQGGAYFFHMGHDPESWPMRSVYL